ncbi:MAG: ABC transporter ATP-binding protein [Spirochaetes bacterium]|nr:ABC transporter ATP-binding protein [Spirochaetota bacterium]
MIRITDLSKQFGKLQAVHALNLQVRRGEIFGIVGPDGAGKSTLLRMMASILRPNTGSIHIDNRDVFDNPFVTKEKLAYMPQQFGLYEDLTVEENIFFFGRIFGVPRREIRKRLVRLYEFSNLEPFRERLAGKLSGGMKQKLGLACCLVHSPSLILLDEPTNGVDPVSRREFWKILYDLLGEGVTIVVTTAYLDEAERCNRIAFLYEGEIIKLGEPKSIRHDMDQAMVEIIVQNSRPVEALLLQSGRVSSVIRSGNSLKIFTDDVKKTRSFLERYLRSKKVEWESIREILPTLEDSFIKIISREENI